MADQDTNKEAASYIRKAFPNLPEGKEAEYAATMDKTKEKAQMKAAAHKKRRGSNKATTPPKPGEQAKQTYTGSIFFAVDFRVTEHPDTVYRKDLNVPWASDHAPSEEEIGLEVDEELLRLREQYSTLSVEGPLDTPKYAAFELQGPLPKERRGKDDQRMVYSGFNPTYDPDHKGECGFAYVRWLFGTDEDAGMIKVCSNNEYISLVFAGLMGRKGHPDRVSPSRKNMDRLLPQNRAFHQHIVEHGVGAGELKNVAAYVGCTLAVLDEDNNVVVTHDPHRSGQRAHVSMMILTIRNGHINPVEDKRLINSASKISGVLARNVQVSGRRQPADENKAAKDPAAAKVELVKVCNRPHEQHNLLVNMDTVLVGEIYRRGGWVKSGKMAPASVRVQENGAIVDFTYYEDATRSEATKYVHAPPNDDNGVAQIILKRMAGDANVANTEVVSVRDVQRMLHRKHFAGLKTSRPNAITQEWLTSLNARNNIHSGFLTGEDTNAVADTMYEACMLDGVYGFDINKAYPSVMYNPPSEWMVLDHNATPVPYDETPIEDLELGLYYAETDDRLFLNGTRVYIREELQMAHKHGVPFKILMMVIASHALPKDIFRDYIHDVITLTHAFGEECAQLRDAMRTARKQLLVIPSGKFGQGAVTVVGDAHITEEKLDALGYGMQHVKHSSQYLIFRELKHHHPRGGTFYLYAHASKERMVEHNIPWNMQIQGFNNVRLVEMMLRVGGTPLAWKTDLVLAKDCLHPDAQPECGVDPASLPQLSEDPAVDAEAREFLATFGRYKRVVQSPIIPQELRACDMLGVPLLPAPWTKHPEISDSAQAEELIQVAQQHGGVLVTAKGGFGKTWMAMKVAERHPDAILLAPTHKASNNLNGCTVHSFVGATGDTIPVRSKRLCKILQHLPPNTPMLVDEAFMLGEFMWHCLDMVAHMRPDLVWYFFGDPGQLGPVEPGLEYDYRNHPTLKMLAGHQRVMLKVPYRCDEQLMEISDRVYKDGRGFDMRQHFGTTDTPGECNLAATNIVTFWVNKQCMLQRKPGDALCILADPHDDRTQEVWLYRDLPLISCQTTKHKKVKLSEDATYMDRLRAGIDMRNNELHDVIEVKERIFRTRSRYDGKERTWKVARFHEFFRVAYCITVHRAQGDTILLDFTIWEHEKMSKRMQYTAITRAKRKGQITLGEVPSHLFKTFWARVRKNLADKLSGHRDTDLRDKRSTVCDVTVEDFVHMIRDCGQCCQHCGVEVKLTNYQKGDREQVTLDRKDNRLGHTKGTW